MSVKYIDNMKNSRGVHARWAELIGSYSFTISHARVVVEDCVSRCPSHLPEPTQEELDMEKDWEADPPPHLDLEKLASVSAQLSVRPERICHMKGDSIQMNMMFDQEKVRVEWERPDEEDEDRQDWAEQLDSTITELHQKIEEEPGTWVHDWGWTQTTEQPMFQNNHINEAEIFYSKDDEVKYSTQRTSQRTTRSKYSTQRTSWSWGLQKMTTKAMKILLTPRKKNEPRQNPCPDVQEGRGHQHSEHSGHTVNSGISEEQVTEKDSEQHNNTYHQNDSQSN